MKYPEDFVNKIICGDCLEVMKEMPDNSVDTVITDPPYGLEFMGKKWDSFRATRKTKSQVHYLGAGMKAPTREKMIGLQEFTYNWAKECLRVAKPGATLMCFGGTRTWHRIAVAIEDAGWQIFDTIAWMYGSGFPKATDISKQLDKKAGKKGRVIGRKECGYQVSISKIRKAQGYRPNLTKSTREVDITEPATPQAKLWNGWKSHGLKPAFEPIICAKKPNERSYAQNAMKWGVAGLNIDQARIGFQNETDEKESKGKNQHSKYPKSVMRNPAPHGIYHQDKRPPEDYKATGRFPANLILDEEAGRMLDEQSGESRSVGGQSFSKKSKIYGKYADDRVEKGCGFADRGGASRYFKQIKL